MPKKPKLDFPKSFLWGASTSAHQIEGGTHNQWSVWELEQAKSLAAQSPYQFDDLENWPDIEAAAKSPDNYVSGRAADHYHQYEKDFDIAQKMNLNAWRFSVEWSRVQPDEGAWSVEAVQHYKKYIQGLKTRGLEPVMTLFHFTLPVWFADKGGFEKRGNIKYFVQFVDRIVSELGTQVKYIITINEPEVYVMMGYINGDWPPAQQKKLKAVGVYKNLAIAHNRAADVIHARNRRFKVSIAKNSPFVYPGDDSWLSVRSAAFAQYVADDWFLKKIIKRCDFIGLNYYMNARIYGYRMHNPNERVSDLGWDMQPDNIGWVIDRLYEKYNKPILVTENGLADADDTFRKWWLTKTILALQRSLQNGVELIGYLHWSLLDNFAWDKGFWPRFGLVAVDYKTQKRTPRPSAVYYAGVVKKLRGIR